MNIVFPMKTPWMLSTTQRELNLQKKGDDLDVNFLGFFGNFCTEDKDRYHDVQLRFIDVKDYRYFPEYSRDDSVRLDRYDWNNLPEYRDEQGSLAGHRKMFDCIWQKTAICPNPSVYEIRESSWVNGASADAMLKHYLILAGDYNLEVLAKSCSVDL